MLLNTGTNINTSLIKKSITNYQCSCSTLPSRTLELLSRANLTISCTRDIRSHKLTDENIYGTKKFEGLFNGYKNLFGSEIVNWYLMNEDKVVGLEDENTTIHLNLFVKLPKNAPFYVNLVSPKTQKYIKNPKSYFYQFINGREFPFVSLHLGLSVEQASTLEGHKTRALFPTNPNSILDQKIIAHRLIDTIKPLKANLKNQNWNGEILLETMNYESNNFGSAYEHITNPNFIIDVINRTSTHLLLDTSHLICAAKNRWNKNPLEYSWEILKYTYNKLREIHITVPEQINGQLYDTHKSIYDSIDSEVINLFFSVLELALKSKKEKQKVILNFETESKNVNLDAVALVSFLTQVLK